MTVPNYYLLAGGGGGRPAVGRAVYNHDFPLFNLWATNEAEARRGLEATARARFRGSRVMHRIVGEGDRTTNNPKNYWYGREVTPEVFRAVRKPAMDYAKQLGLKLILTAEFHYGLTTSRLHDEWDWAEEASGLIADDGNASVVLNVETLGNEVDVNRPDIAYDVRVAMSQAGELQRIWRRNLGCLVSNGSFGEESTFTDPAYPNRPNLLTSAQGADYLDVHNSGDVHRVHTMWYDTQFKGIDPRAILEGEVGGENLPYPLFQQGGDCSHPQNDPHLLHTEIAMMSITGQIPVYLNGPGVRRWYPLDSTIYFYKIVKSLDPLPADVETWRDENNPSWWIKGREFVYVGLEGWKQIYYPPHPIAHATFYDMDGAAGESIGPAHPPPDWVGGIVRGEFE